MVTDVGEIIVLDGGFQYLHLGVSFLSKSNVSVFFTRTD